MAAAVSSAAHGEVTAGVAGQPKVLPLTSLRFFAALYVVIHHSLRNPFPSITDATLIGLFQRFGFSSVTFFFVLSGYILALVYLSRRPGGSERVPQRRFWAARFARIYPLYFMTILLDVPNLFLYRLPRYGAPGAAGKTAITFLGNALLLQEWIPRLHGLDFPNWSISVEAFFYLVFPFLGVWLWRLPLRRAMVLIAVWYVGQWMLLTHSGGSGLAKVKPFLGPLWSLYLFAGGIVLAKLHMAVAGRPGGRALLARLGPALLGVAITGFSVCVVLSPHLSWNLFPGLLLFPLCLPVVLGGASGNHWLDRCLSSAPLVLLGEASYGLYLLHIPVWSYMFGYRLLPVCAWSYVLYLAVSIGLSVVSFRFFETPARHFLLHSLVVRTRETEVTASMAQ